MTKETTTKRRISVAVRMNNGDEFIVFHYSPEDCIEADRALFHQQLLEHSAMVMEDKLLIPYNVSSVAINDAPEAAAQAAQ